MRGPNYSPYLGEARAPLGYSHNWETEVGTLAAKSLGRAGDRIRAPKRAVPRTLSAKVLRLGRLSEEFVPAVWVRLALSPRVLSDWPPLAGQSPQRKMNEDPVLGPLAVIGMWDGRVATKLHGRTRLPGGSGMVRSFICDKSTSASCILGKHSQRSAGEQLFPKLARPSFADGIRSVARHLAKGQLMC